MLMMMMRRNDRTHQIRDSTGQTDARANDVISYRRDVLQQTAIRFFIREKEDARASSATPRRPKLEEQPLSSRSEPTELTKKDQPNEQPRQTSDPIHHKDKVNISSTALGLERADSSLSVPDVNMASTTAPSSNQSISTGTMSLGIGVAPNLEPFEPIAEVSEAEDRRTQSTQRSGSHSQNRIKVPTVNSLGSSRACDLDLQSSESLRFQDQMVWLYGSSPGSSNSLLQPPHDSHAGGKRSIGTVNSLASSEALNVGDVGRFRRTETLQLSNERRDAAAKEAATLALLKELQKEQQKRNSNSLDSLASSWLEIDSGQESRQLSASPEGRDAENLEPALDFPDLPERRSQALALPLSRSRQGSRQGRRPVLSVASLENIEEAMDEDGSFQFPSKLGADRQPLRSARMSSLAPKILEKDPVTIPSFESPGFLLELQKDGGKMADSATLLSMSDNIHLVLIKMDPSGDTTLIGSHFLAWRDILSSANGRLVCPVEINGVGGEAKVPMGILEIKFEIIPRLTQMLTKDVITAQISLEHSRIAERERLFLVYAKQWWREFLQIRASHSNRLVKIFAQDECGTNRPVCSFVCPLRAGRLLDSPRQAARFVSLLGYEHVPSVGGGKAEMWSSLHAFLCKGKGDCEDHAVLLCSLLLGFGLNAYVCVGTKAKGAAHTWVVTISPEGGVTFWESLTAHRYSHCPINPDDPPALKQSSPGHPYKTVGCVFNHQSFYANSQPTDSAEVCLFELHNEAKWKSMSEDAIRSVCGPKLLPSGPVLPPLYPPSVDAALVSNDMEHELRGLVTDHRRDLGLNTAWDDELSYILTPALAAYELEHSTGISAGNEEFQQAIRRAIPDGHTFKGFPIQFVHRNARRAFATCLRSPVCEEIVCCRGDHVRLAVRVRVFTYPESACAVWIMFAVRYRSIL